MTHNSASGKPIEETIAVICEHGICRSEDTHEARLRRERVVAEAAMSSNRIGINFVDQVGWSLSSPRRRAKVAARTRAARPTKSGS